MQSVLLVAAMMVQGQNPLAQIEVVKAQDKMYDQTRERILAAEKLKRGMDVSSSIARLRADLILEDKKVDPSLRDEIKVLSKLLEIQEKRFDKTLKAAAAKLVEDLPIRANIIKLRDAGLFSNAQILINARHGILKAAGRKYADIEYEGQIYDSYILSLQKRLDEAKQPPIIE